MKPYVIWKGMLSTLIALSVIVLVYVMIVLSDGLPTLEELESPRQDLATQVISADGELLEHFAATRRTYIPFDSIPPAFINALIATEDRAFYDHWGVHTMRIIKAALKNVFAFRAKEGASTITQQLARNLYFTQEQTISRKIREAWTALQIERTYTKHEILEMYANTVYYGRGSYGIREASHTYFNKEPRKLTIAECAYLVGLFKAPERYNRDDSAGIGRRNLILTMMEDEGYITSTELTAASSEVLAKPQPEEIWRGIAPHFVEMIRQQLGRNGDWNDKLAGRDLYRDGLVIHTTLNARVQRYANESVAEHLAQYQALFDRSWKWRDHADVLTSVIRKSVQQRTDYIAANKAGRERIMKRAFRDREFVDSVKRIASAIQTGVVVLDARSGAILAMVGASPLAMKLDKAARYSLNHVTQIKRQPGSSFKPFVYASALEKGLTPDSPIESGPFSTVLSTGETWSPRGSSKQGGPMPLRTALKFSTNTVAARLITEVTTPSAVVEICRRMGITSPLSAVPAIALGAVEVSPLELTAAYIPFVNHGLAVAPAAITRIEDKFGNVLYEARLPSSVNDAVSSTVSQNMLSMMRGVVDGGTGSRVRQYYRQAAAGKTGTTNDFADAWFIGFTPQLVGGVWTGFDDRRVKFTGDYGQGGRAAAPIWGRLMQKVWNDKRLGYTMSNFPVESIASDTVSSELIANPPSDQIEDDTSSRITE
ncbi:MAG: PBP1A family penicillin-binding protein [Ignavibacteriae bacterium]|nr:MAG: PBP1A family penicillin-binding protein [Ignavibacteriota bacterium]